MGESISDIESQASAGDLSAQLQMAHRLFAEGQTEPGRNWLRKAAASGPADLKLALGEHLLTNAPFDVSEALRWTREALAAGSAEAAHRFAVFAAEGVGEPQSWPNALHNVMHAATLGHRVAQAELVGLAGDWALAASVLTGTGSAPNLDGLADRIDIPSLLAVPPSQTLLASPRVVSIPGFLSHGLCNWLIERARPDLKRAQTFNPRTGGAQVVEGRNHSCIGFNVARSDVVLSIIRARMAVLTGLSLLGFEDTSVLHYAPGEQFAPHFDFIEPNTPAALKEIASTGQRAVTFLAYLNEGYEGGETSFPRLAASYKGKRGDALFYFNIMPDGSPDRRTLHTGTALKGGEKWLMSQWIRSRPAWISPQ